jgi:tRNA1Val (adenine37-N6)-methyltransferase
VTAPGGLTHDAFLGGRVRAWQPANGYRAATDPVLLAASIPARAGDRVLDLGCGAGVATLCLAARVPGIAPVGLELQPDYALLARRNADEAGLDFEILDGDVRTPPPALTRQSFDHVMANPPWFDDGPAARDSGRATARHEAAPLGAWIEIGTRRLLPGGTVSLILPATRLADLLTGFDRRLGSVIVKPLCPRTGRDAARVIVRATKGGRAPLRLAAPLVLHRGATHERDAADWTDAAEAILRHGAALAL